MLFAYELEDASLTAIEAPSGEDGLRADALFPGSNPGGASNI